MRVNNKSIIIDKLRNSDVPISGEELSVQLKISRTAIWKNIKKLGEEGYSITSSHNGYLLKKEEDLLLPYEFVEDNELYIYNQSTGSTMDIARSLIQKHRGIDGQVIVAERQNQGRGKGDTSFESPTGGLYFTLILFPNTPLQDINLYPMAGLLATLENLKKITGIDVYPKWPFETWSKNKKISGVLHEYSIKGNRCEWLTMGIGINIGKEIPRRRLLESIKKDIFNLLKDKETILDKYISKLDIINSHYTFEIEGKNINGRVLNIDRLGTLLLNNSGGTEYGYIGNSSIKEIK